MSPCGVNRQAEVHKRQHNKNKLTKLSQYLSETTHPRTIQSDLLCENGRLAQHVALSLLPVVTSCCCCPLQTITCIITSPSLFFFLSVARRRAAPGRQGLRRCFSFATLGLCWSCVWARPPARGGRGASARQREQHRRRLAVRGQGSAPLSG